MWNWFTKKTSQVGIVGQPARVIVGPLDGPHADRARERMARLRLAIPDREARGLPVAQHKRELAILELQMTATLESC